MKSLKKRTWYLFPWTLVANSIVVGVVTGGPAFRIGGHHFTARLNTQAGCVVSVGKAYTDLAVRARLLATIFGPHYRRQTKERRYAC